MNGYVICEKCGSFSYQRDGICRDCPTPEDIAWYEELKKKWTEYNHRPEVIARTKAYYQRPDVKQRLVDYWQDDKVKQKKREESRTPEVKKQKSDYYYSKKMLKIETKESYQVLTNNTTNDQNTEQPYNTQQTQ